MATPVTSVVTAPAARPPQILVIPGHRVRMSVKAAEDALEFDFRSRVIRPDLGPDYCRRPGIYLHDVLANLSDSRAILLNGNNVGYWGNQFVIDDGRLVYKLKGPLFDDGRLHAHATGDHAFFVDSQRNPHRFQIADVKLFGRPKILAIRASTSMWSPVTSRPTAFRGSRCCARVERCGASTASTPGIRGCSSTWGAPARRQVSGDPRLRLTPAGRGRPPGAPSDDRSRPEPRPRHRPTRRRTHGIQPGMTVARAADLLATRFVFATPSC